MKIIMKILLCLTLTALLPQGAMAQTAKQRYQSGLAMMKKGNWSGAIAEFNASKKQNKSPENVKNCNAQIEKCRREMNRPAQQRTDKTVEAPAIVYRLTLSTHELLVTASPAKEDCVVSVTAEPDGIWEIEPIQNLTFQEDKWISPNRVDGDNKTLSFAITPNDRTEERTADVPVSYNGVYETIHVRQLAKPVTFELEKYVFSDLSKKGDHIVIDIKTNSTKTYEDTGRNWQIASMPEWCHLRQQTEVKKKGFLEKAGSRFNSLWTGDEYSNVNVVGSTETSVYIDVDENLDKERTGTIVVEVQGETRKVTIVQKGKKK